MPDFDSMDVGDHGFDTESYRSHATTRARVSERLGLLVIAQHWRDARALSWDKQYGTHTHRWST